jgi:hypothetical protein
MTVNWSPLVNTRFSLEGGVSLQDGFVEELTFASGKKRTWLRNSYVPRVFPSLNLLLDNRIKLENGKTEFEEFEDWYNRSLRYGSFTFQTVKLGWKEKPFIKTPAMGIYKFLEVPEYDRLDGLVLAAFGLREEAFTPEVFYSYLTAQTGEILLTGNGNMIIAVGV